MIEFHNPEAEAAQEPIPYELSLPIRGETVELGLLANGFPDSVPFLDHLAEALRALEPGLQITRFDKGNPTFPAGEALLKDMTASCAGVVAAYGH